MTDSAEAVLIARAAGGDRRAFEELVRAHQSAVRNQLRGLVRGDPALADDLAQEVFVRAWKHIGEFRGDARFSTWLYRIAYRSFLMHRRRCGVAPAHTDGVDHDRDGATGGDRDPALRIDVQRALSQLGAAQRAAIVCCYHLDLSHQEAARVLGVPLGTLKSQLARGKERLRRLLAQWAAETAS